MHLDCFMQPASKSTQMVLVRGGARGKQKEKIRCEYTDGGAHAVGILHFPVS